MWEIGRLTATARNTGAEARLAIENDRYEEDLNAPVAQIRYSEWDKKCFTTIY